MIALKKAMESDINSTPEKVAAFSGVWPISSVRNVMVRVKDTASFIAKARSIHGDKYDYSKTEYAGAQNPITITCRKCGDVVIAEAKSHLLAKYPSGCTRTCGNPKQRQQRVFDTESFIAASVEVHGDTYGYENSIYIAANEPITITCRKCGPIVIASALSHYRKKNPCGCKFCKIEKSLESRGRACRCVQCGVREKYMAASKLCSACRVEAKEQKRRLREQSLKRRCVRCNCEFVATRSDHVVCSKQCKTPSRIAFVECVSCKRVFSKLESLVRENNCCSLECQNEWALKVNQHLNQPGLTQEQWLQKSKLSKARWVARRSRERSYKSLWCIRWKRRISSASGLLRVRLPPSLAVGKKRKPCSFSEACEIELRRIKGKRVAFELSDWDKRVHKAVGCLRKRCQKRQLSASMGNPLGVVHLTLGSDLG